MRDRRLKDTMLTNLMMMMMMQAVLLVAVVGLAAAKPQPKELTLTEGRIIGGEEAPKRQ